MESSINILCTRPIDDVLIQSAKNAGVLIDVLSFIETEIIDSNIIQKKIAQAASLNTTVVFTSMNAVEAVVKNLKSVPHWKIFCMGNTTKQLVENFFGKEAIAGIAESAVTLANVIAQHKNPDQIIFFCGNQRRNELPEILDNAGIALNEIEVYKTMHLQQQVKKQYQGILFFSPSAVESFFASNKINPQTIFFAIGFTTAATIEKFCSNKIITACNATKESLVLQMINFFSSIKKIKNNFFE